MESHENIRLRLQKQEGTFSKMTPFCLGRVHTRVLRWFFSEKSMILHLLFGCVLLLFRQRQKSFAVVILSFHWFFIDFSMNLLWFFGVKVVVWTRPYGLRRNNRNRKSGFEQLASHEKSFKIHTLLRPRSHYSFYAEKSK